MVLMYRKLTRCMLPAYICTFPLYIMSFPFLLVWECAYRAEGGAGVGCSVHPCAAAAGWECAKLINWRPLGTCMEIS